MSDTAANTSCFVVQIFVVPEKDIKQLEMESDDSDTYTAEVCLPLL